MHSQTSVESLAPVPGAPETKDIDGKMWHWCAHCGFWHLSHGTATHKDLAQLPPLHSKTTQMATASTAVGPPSYSGLQFCGEAMFGKEWLLARFSCGFIVVSPLGICGLSSSLHG